MPFRPEELHALDVAQEIQIVTRVDDDRTRITTIWIVVDNGNVFVRSVRGEQGRWYREALSDPHVEIDDRGRRLEANAIPVHDPDSIRHINDGLKRKYVGQDGYDDMLVQGVLASNFRLEPRFPDELPLEAPAYLGSDEPSELRTSIDVSMLDGGQPVEEDVILQPHKSA